jgi:hypoxanthine phosphoribosyltransferase
VKSGVKQVYSPSGVAVRVANLGRAISQDYAGRTVDVVIVLEDAFIFAADLVRRIGQPVVCHFVRTEMRDIKLGGYDRREVFFSRPPNLRGRDVLMVGAVLHSGVVQEFLVRRLLENRPRSLRIAVLLDKPRDRKVDLKPDYIGFSAASNHYVGYGLPGARGLYRNLPCVGVLRGSRRRAGARAGKRARQAR